MKVALAMSTPLGRLSRVVAGLVLIAAGLFVLNGAVGLAVALFGVLPLVTGLGNICPISPFYGLPLRACPASTRGRSGESQ